MPTVKNFAEVEAITLTDLKCSMLEKYYICAAGRKFTGHWTMDNGHVIKVTSVQ